jgi:hypothetical protein
MEVKMSRDRKLMTSGAAQITLAPDRGRVLQVGIAGHDAFWENRAWSGDWNVGGDRLWLAPEVAWNWKTMKVDFTQCEVPEEEDSGRWQVTSESDDYCRIEQRVTLAHRHRAGRSPLIYAETLR